MKHFCLWVLRLRVRRVLLTAVFLLAVLFARRHYNVKMRHVTSTKLPCGDYLQRLLLSHSSRNTTGFSVHLLLRNNFTHMCLVYKAAASTLHKTACAYNERAGAPVEYGLHGDARLIDHRGWVSSLKSAQHHWAIVRDPIERFFSGFAYGCRTEENREYGCFDMDVLHFIDKLYEFVFHGREAHAGMHLLYPQYWSCEFSANRYNYEIYPMAKGQKKQFETVLWENMAVNADRNVLDKTYCDMKRKLARAVTNVHSTPLSTLQRLMDRVSKDPKRSLKLLFIYAQDYYHFDFKVPRWLAKSCRGETSCVEALVTSLDGHFTFPFAARRPAYEPPYCLSRKNEIGDVLSFPEDTRPLRRSGRPFRICGGLDYYFL